jgi:membrane fusion protein (multidrug efflux system)
MARRRTALVLIPILLTSACGKKQSANEAQRPGGENRSARHASGAGGPPGTFAGHPEGMAAVPVGAAPVERRDISSYIETNGVLEAENEVDLIARMNGPIVELNTEEGMTVRRGQPLARIDDRDIRSDLEIARVAQAEAKLDFERAERLRASQLISPEEYEQAANAFETAEARYEGTRILLGYTEITAPFDGLIVNRYIDFAQQVSPGAPLFRISDFDPLLCPIQVPERELPRLAVGQSAYLTVEAWSGERFAARVLRISPVVNAATGTVKVTLDVTPDKRLRPGMFARVFLETERRTASLVIPKAALSLESLGDTVYVVGDGVAQRRDVTLGFREGDFVEVTAGLEEAEQVVVIGQDGLSDGTPIRVLGEEENGGSAVAEATEGPQGPSRGAGPGGFGGHRMDPSQMTPEQLERVKELMRARGLTEEEIEARIGRSRARAEEGQGQ